MTWVETDLRVWEPTQHFDLVTTHYAHPAMPQLEFYARIAEWVARGGSLLVVGHLRAHGHSHGHAPEEATATVAGITTLLDGEEWDVVTAREQSRATSNGTEPHDVVVRATRRAAW